MIHVADEYYVDADPYSFVVYRKGKHGEKSKRKGEEKWEDIAYYPTRKMVVDKILDLALTKAVNKDILGCVNLVEGAKEHFEELFELRLKWEDPKAVKTK